MKDVIGDVIVCGMVHWISVALMRRWGRDVMYILLLTYSAGEHIVLGISVAPMIHRGGRDVVLCVLILCQPR